MSVEDANGLLTPRSSVEASRSEEKAKVSGRCSLLDLPGEILSQIATYLPLAETLPFLSLHPRLLGLTRSHLSPLPEVIHHALIAGPPYPAVLEVLPSLSLYRPDDDGRMWIETLVRARPRWILERLVIGPRWKERVWREAFERRFLPSWKSYKKEGDTWRAVFLRTLSRLEHRYLGCTHEESWTRFLTLHRNGSGSLNRMYSRTFDPYEIFDELKGQNNFAAQPTTLRVLVHLQDVRIIVLGVLYAQPSLFVNPNAHLLLHPPLLRGVYEPDRHPDDTDKLDEGYASREQRDQGPSRSQTSNAGPTEAYYPLVRTMSPSTPETTSYGLADGPMPNFRQRLSSKIPGVTRRSSTSGRPFSDPPFPHEPPSSLARFGAALTHVRSRESEDARPRKWSFGRARSNSNVNAATSSGVPNAQAVTETESPEPVETAAGLAAVAESSTARQESATPMRRPSPSTRKQRPTLPYPPIVHPTPAYPHRLYPNFTPNLNPHENDANADAILENIQDLRRQHPDLEDDEGDTYWAGDAPWPDGSKRVEVGPHSERLRWVGPMLVIAHLHPCDRTAQRPLGAAPGRAEGAHPDLGPRGMYVSMGFEDLEAVCPWLELKGGGAHHAEARRDGLGF